VQFVGVSHGGLGLGTDLGDGLGIEACEIGQGIQFEGAAGSDGAGTPLFERGAVQKGIGVGVENLVAEGGGLARIAGDKLHFAGFDSLEQLEPARPVHRLMEAVVYGLAHQGVVGDGDVSHHVLQASRLCRKDGGEQVFCAKALQRRRYTPASFLPQHGQCARDVPSPAGAEHGGRKQRLRQHVVGVLRVEHLEHMLQREAVLGAQREHNAVIVGAGLQFEVETAAEALAHGQAPGTVDPRPERGVDDKLHAARLVEKSLEHHLLLRGHQPQGGLLRRHVKHRLLCGPAAGPALVAQPLHGRGANAA